KRQLWWPWYAPSAQSEEGQDEQNDHNESYQVDQSAHWILLGFQNVNGRRCSRLRCGCGDHMVEDRTGEACGVQEPGLCRARPDSGRSPSNARLSTRSTTT